MTETFDLSAKEFDEYLRRVLRHYNPEHFTYLIAQKYRQAQADPNLLSRYPPHYLLHILEACYAYSHEYNLFEMTDSVFEDFLRKATSLRPDPSIQALLGHEAIFVPSLLHYFHRTQLALQDKPHARLIARVCEIFDNTNRMPTFVSLFHRHFGIFPRDFIVASMYIAVQSSNHDACFIDRAYLKSISELGFNRSKFIRGAKILSQTVGDAGKQYRRKASEQIGPTPHLFYQRVPSIYKKPSVYFPVSQRLWTPFPDLVSRFLSEELIGLARDIGKFYGNGHQGNIGNEIGLAFEAYTDDCLSLLNVERVSPNNQTHHHSKNCDFVLSTQRYTLFIECKTVQYTQEYITQSAYTNSAAINTVAQGYNQILHDTRFITNPRDRRAIGIVVTPGVIPGMNDPQTFDAISTKLETPASTRDAKQPDHILCHISIGQLETIIDLATQDGMSIDYVMDYILYSRVYSDHAEKWDAPIQALYKTIKQPKVNAFWINRSQSLMNELRGEHAR